MVSTVLFVHSIILGRGTVASVIKNWTAFISIRWRSTDGRDVERGGSHGGEAAREQMASGEPQRPEASTARSRVPRFFLKKKLLKIDEPTSMNCKRRRKKNFCSTVAVMGVVSRGPDRHGSDHVSNAFPWTG
jgi:hypothetical protein